MTRIPTRNPALRQAQGMIRGLSLAKSTTRRLRLAKTTCRQAQGTIRRTRGTTRRLRLAKTTCRQAQSMIRRALGTIGRSQGTTPQAQGATRIQALRPAQGPGWWLGREGRTEPVGWWHRESAPARPDDAAVP